MSQNLPNVSSGQLFATVKAPYLDYLRALGDGWDEAVTMRKSLMDAVGRLQKLREYPRPRAFGGGGNHSTFAAILDVRADVASNNNAVAVAAQIFKSQIQGPLEGTVDPRVADKFFKILRDCTPDVHSRIIVLQDSISPTMPDDRLIEALFFSHVLGVELQLPPTYVCSLSQRRDLKEVSRTRLYQDPTFMDSHVKFQMSHGQSDNIGMYLGRTRVGSGMPHIGKSRTELGSCCTFSHTMAISGNQPPSPQLRPNERRLA